MWDAFAGGINELRIWEVARTREQIQQSMCIELSGTEPGLVGYWKFNEAGGQTAYDSSVGGNDGRLGDSDGSDSADPAWIPAQLPTAAARTTWGTLKSMY
jgi:hypothetical protein